MKKGLAIFLTIFVFIGCETIPIVKVVKIEDGKYELTVSNYYCNMHKNLDNFSILKNGYTEIIDDMDVCNKCGRKFSEHETTGEHFRKLANDNNWL